MATGGRFTDERELTPDERFDSESQEQAVTLTVPANIIRPNDFAKLTLVCSELRADRGGGGSAYASNIVSYLPYDTSKPMVAVTKDKAAFFYGRGSYILLNYIQSCVMKVVGNMLLQGNLTLKGDLTADRIISDGFFACGNVSEYGYLKWYRGRQVGTENLRGGQYRITHNIGHTNYVITGAIVGTERMFLRVEWKGANSAIISLHAGVSTDYNTTFPSAFDFTIDAGVH